MKIDDFAAVTLHEDGHIVVFRHATDGVIDGNMSVYHSAHVLCGGTRATRVAFLDGVAQVFGHFGGGRWKITAEASEEYLHATKTGVRLESVETSDIVFVEAVAVRGRHVSCAFTGECGHRIDSLTNTRCDRALGHTRSASSFLSAGAVWAINFVRDVFYPHVPSIRTYSNIDTDHE